MALIGFHKLFNPQDNAHVDEEFRLEGLKVLEALSPEVVSIRVPFCAHNTLFVLT